MDPGELPQFSDPPCSPLLPERRSTGKMVAGIVLTGIGSAALLNGLAVTGGALASGGEYSGLTAVIIGLPLVAGSGLLAGIGIPLWVSGASRQSAATAGAPPPPPPVTASLAVGPGSAALRLSF